MKIRILLIGLLAATVLLSGCGGDPAPPPPASTATSSPTSTAPTATRARATATTRPAPSPTIARTATTAPPADLPTGWQEFTSQEGAFSVWVPKIPRPTTTSADSPTGKIDTYIFEVLVDGVDYTVSYTDLSAEVLQTDSDTLLNQIRDGQLGVINATLREEHPITLGSYPGRELIADAADGRILKSRVYLVNARLYQVIVLTQSEDRLADEGASFFNSFRVGEQIATTTDPAPDSWQRYTPADAGFAVLLPGTPQESSSKLNLAAAPLVMHQATVLQLPQVFSVMYTDANAAIGKTDLKKALDEAQVGMVDSAKGTIVAQQDITLQTYSGRDVYLRTADGTAHLRLYIIKDRLYALIATLPTDNAATGDEIAKTFFDSFTLLGQ